MAPTPARALWQALLDNAARILVDADRLVPSPRAQSLVVLAREEVGKAVWVYETFWNAWNAWNDGDEDPIEVSELRKQGCRHLAKLMKATDFATALVVPRRSASLIALASQSRESSRVPVVGNDDAAIPHSAN